jgi:hypothetical protein
MQKGGTKCTYFLSAYLTDVLHCLMISVVTQIGFRWGLGVQHYIVLLALWSIADPLFIICWAYLTIKLMGMPAKASFIIIATFQGIISVISTSFSAELLLVPTYFEESVTKVRLSFCFLPSWLMVNGVQYMMFTTPVAIRYNLGLTLDEIGEFSDFGQYGAYIEFWGLIILFAFYGLIVLFITAGGCNRCRPKRQNLEREPTPNEDEFVREERERIANEIDGISALSSNIEARREMDILKVHNLVK